MRLVEKEIETQITNMWALGPGEYQPTATFGSLGADDLDVTSLIMQLEDIYPIDKLSTLQLNINNTAIDLIELIQNTIKVL